MSTETKIESAEQLAEAFAAGRYDEVIAGLQAMRPDLGDADMAIELSLAAAKVLSEHYAALRKAAEKAAEKIDVALLADPRPLSDYAQARDILRAALAAGEPA